MSTFSGLSTAMTSLYANRRGIEVTGQNVANANTDGYTRQRVDLKAMGGATSPGIFAQASSIGSGVSLDQISRLNDTFLENRGRIEHAQSEYLAGKKDMLARVEQVFAEPSDTGIQSQLTELWGSFADLSNRPGDDSARTVVLQRASVVVDSIRGASQSLGSLWQTGREQLDTMTSEINSTAKSVAEMNKVVKTTAASGQPANEVADQRDRLVMKLAELTGARGVARDDGSVDVYLGGSTLVSGGDSRSIEVTGATVMSQQATDPLKLRWADSKAVAESTSGKLAASMESLGVTLTDYSKQLDDVAGRLASTVNAQHALGFDRAGKAGGAFFSGTTADTLQMAITDPNDVAASSTAGGSLDGANADALAEMAKRPDGADKKYRQMVVDLGVFTQTVNRRADIQTSVVNDLDDARSGQSGVSIDEEMTNMVAFERSYQAAAKVISTIDDMLDTLINRMGR